MRYFFISFGVIVLGSLGVALYFRFKKPEQFKAWFSNEMLDKLFIKPIDGISRWCGALIQRVSANSRTSVTTPTLPSGSVRPWLPPWPHRRWQPCKKKSSKTLRTSNPSTSRTSSPESARRPSYNSFRISWSSAS